MSTYVERSPLLAAFLLAVLLLVPACAERQRMNAVEFEPHLEKAYNARELYGVGFAGYTDPDEPGNVRLLGWMQGAYTSHSYFAKLVHIGAPKVLLSSKDGEAHMVPLKWVGEVPPAEFDGKLFIRIYSLDEGLIHWSRDSNGSWDFDGTD